MPSGIRAVLLRSYVPSLLHTRQVTVQQPFSVVRTHRRVIALASTIIRRAVNRVIRATGHPRAGASQHVGIAPRICIVEQVAVEDRAYGAYDGPPFRSDLDPSLLHFDQSHFLICGQLLELGPEVAIEIHEIRNLSRSLW